MQESLDSDVTSMGYICPGHGFKGKQNTIRNDEDLVAMYNVAYQKKKEIFLRCYALFPGNDASEKDAPQKRPLPKDSENASDSSKCGKKIRKSRDI